MAEGRSRGGAWTYVVLAALALTVFAVVNRASSADAPPVAAAPSSSTPTALPDPSPISVITVQPLVSTRLAPGTTPGPGPHCTRTTCCSTRVSTFGTDADISRVIAAFQHRGYAYAAPPLVAPVSGDAKTSGTYLRWLGELPGDTGSWRLVNVSTGAMNGRTNWKTVFEVSRADC